MPEDVEPQGPVADLLAAAERSTAPWLRRATAKVAPHADGGGTGEPWPDLDEAIEVAAAGILDRLRILLATDVDEQRTNPLSIYRAGVRPVTDLLRHHGVSEPAGDAFAANHFPDDPYRLGPATWADIDEELQLPGLVWGAWKAKTVLDRRRSEGRR